MISLRNAISTITASFPRLKNTTAKVPKYLNSNLVPGYLRYVQLANKIKSVLLVEYIILTAEPVTTSRRTINLLVAEELEIRTYVLLWIYLMMMVMRIWIGTE